MSKEIVNHIIKMPYTDWEVTSRNSSESSSSFVIKHRTHDLHMKLEDFCGNIRYSVLVGSEEIGIIDPQFQTYFMHVLNYETVVARRQHEVKVTKMFLDMIKEGTE